MDSDHSNSRDWNSHSYAKKTTILKANNKFSRKHFNREQSSPYSTPKKVKKLDFRSPMANRHLDTVLPVVKSSRPPPNRVLKLDFDTNATKISKNADTSLNNGNINSKRPTESIFAFQLSPTSKKIKNTNLQPNEDIEDPIVDSIFEDKKSLTIKTDAEVQSKFKTKEKEDDVENEFNVFRDAIIKKTINGTLSCPVNIESDSDNEECNEGTDIGDEKGGSHILGGLRRSLRKNQEDLVYCIFPKNASDAVTIYRSDLTRLEPDSQLNDSIIDFYLRYLKEHVFEKEQSRRLYIFNTFFYNTLKSEGYDKVTSWTKNVNIFDYDFILIPINQNYHWRLAVVCFIKNAIEGDEKASSSFILLFDSMYTSGPKIFNDIRMYLNKEAESKGLTNANFSKTTTPGITPRTPKQDNYSDCGLFLLHYAELFGVNLPSPSDMTRSHIQALYGQKWFDPEDAKKKRIVIQEILAQLSNQM